MLESTQTACELLHVIERDDLNLDFLPIVLGESRFHRHEAFTAYGYLALVRQIIATENATCIDILLEGRDWLARCDDDCARAALEFARSSPIVLERIANRATARLRATGRPSAEPAAAEPN